jgi:hypothetical protein
VVQQIYNRKFTDRWWDGVELHAGPTLEDQVKEILEVQKDNAKVVCEWMERNKASMDNVCAKLDKLNEVMMKMQDEHESLKELVNSCVAKQKVTEQECDLMDKWRRRNNILVFSIEEYPHETYFDTLKITEDILKTKVNVEIANWHIEKVDRLGR